MLNYVLPLYRPPSEADNLIIQATIGCSFNQCSFCSMYKQKQYQQRQFVQVKQDIDAAAKMDNTFRRVFLADGDALAMDTAALLEILNYLQLRFSGLQRVSCYATPSNVLNKSPDELEQLRQNGLKLVYLGVETGDDQLLKLISKGATSRSIETALLKCDSAGIKVSATIILGLGGLALSEQHIKNTAALFNNAPVNYLSTLQLYLDPAEKLNFERRFTSGFHALHDSQILLELQQLILQLNPPAPVIFRSNHASNALPLAGTLDKDQPRLLLEIKEAIEGSRLLTPEYFRSL